MQSLRGCSLLLRRRSGFCTNWGATACWTCLLPPMRGLVALWILEFGAKDFDLPGSSRVHNPNWISLQSFLQQLCCCWPLIIIIHGVWCGPVFSCGFCIMRKKTLLRNVVFAVLEIQNQGGEGWLNLQPVTKLAAVCINWADACHGSSRISSVSPLLPEPGRRTLTVNALHHARQTKEMRWFGVY